MAELQLFISLCINSTNDLDQNIVQGIKLCCDLTSMNLLFNQYSIQMLQDNWFKHFLEAFNHCKKLTKFSINILNIVMPITYISSLQNLLTISDNLQDVQIFLQFLSLGDKHLKGITAGLMKQKKQKLQSEIQGNYLSSLDYLDLDIGSNNKVFQTTLKSFQTDMVNL
ncbi:hypothetical protein ABPG72_015168 [Tetrahymena utriculariae]